MDDTESQFLSLTPNLFFLRRNFECLPCFHLFTVSMNRSLIHTGSLGGRAGAGLLSILTTANQGPGSVSQVSNPTSNSVMVVTAATCWRPAPRPIAARLVTVAVAVGWPPVNWYWPLSQTMCSR